MVLNGSEPIRQVVGYLHLELIMQWFRMMHMKPYYVFMCEAS
jgi:hypothetical protein